VTGEQTFSFSLTDIDNYKVVKHYNNEKSAQRDANTARALAIVRFGHRPPARPPARPLQTHKHTDRTDYNTLRR